MKRKNKPTGIDGIVFSTDPSFARASDETPVESLPASQQKLLIRLDKKQRAGKSVTLIEGFIGREEDLEQLGKSLKNFCGTGGSVKDGEVIIQGDQRDKVLQWLVKNDYSKSKKA